MAQEACKGISMEDLFEALKQGVSLDKYRDARGFGDRVSHSQALDIAATDDRLSVNDYWRGLKLKLSHDTIMELVAERINLSKLLDFYSTIHVPFDVAKRIYMVGFDEVGPCSYRFMTASMDLDAAIAALQDLRMGSTDGRRLLYYRSHVSDGSMSAQDAYALAKRL